HRRASLYRAAVRLARSGAGARLAGAPLRVHPGAGLPAPDRRIADPEAGRLSADPAPPRAGRRDKRLASRIGRSDDLNMVDARNLIRYGGEFVDEVISRAEGSWLTTTEGRRILDFTSGQMCATIGHSQPAMVAAVG